MHREATQGGDADRIRERSEFATGDGMDNIIVEDVRSYYA